MISMHDFSVIALLIFLEGILSIDNALVIAILVKPLPIEQRKKALSYGLVGAIAFRFIAISLAVYLIHLTWIKYLGGAYLLYLSITHWFKKGSLEDFEKPYKQRSFWQTVIIIELTDIAFAADSILTAVAIAQKLWVILVGGILGMLFMRFAAFLFIKLLEMFPSFEETAYILIFIIGVKLILEGMHIPHIDFRSSSNLAYWFFWIAMTGGVLYGFRKKPKRVLTNQKSSTK